MSPCRSSSSSSSSSSSYQPCLSMPLSWLSRSGEPIRPNPFCDRAVLLIQSSCLVDQLTSSVSACCACSLQQNLLQQSDASFLLIGVFAGPYIKWFLDKLGHEGLNKMLGEAHIK